MTNDALRQRFLDFRQRLYGAHDLSVVDEFLHPEFSSHSPLLRARGRAAYKAFAQGFFVGVPDLRPLEQTVLVEGDRLMAMTSWQATHAGTFLGRPATGKTLHFATADRYQLRDGMLFEHWDVVDRLEASVAIGLLQQSPDLSARASAG